MPATSPPFDLLVVGDANPDVVLGPLDGPLAFGQREQLVPTGLLTLGGSGAIMACGAARLGLKVAFAGRVGADDTGRYVRDALAARGVDVCALSVDPDLPSPLTAVLNRDGDRAILTAPGTLQATGGDDVPAALLARCRHVHAASYFLMPKLAAALPDLFRAARGHGATTSLDTNDDPAGGWDPAGIAAVLAVTDYLLPNAQEARALSGALAGLGGGRAAGGRGAPGTDPDGGSHGGAAPGAPGTDQAVGAAGFGLARAAADLAAYGPTVVVKDGAAGALAHDGRRLLRAPAVPVAPLDTVGAGDSFDAGLVAGVLRGLPPGDALALAAACGAMSTRAHGGTAAQPGWDEALAAASLTSAPRTGQNDGEST